MNIWLASHCVHNYKPSKFDCEHYYVMLQLFWKALWRTNLTWIHLFTMQRETCFRIAWIPSINVTLDRRVKLHFNIKCMPKMQKVSVYYEVEQSFRVQWKEEKASSKQAPSTYIQDAMCCWTNSSIQVKNSLNELFKANWNDVEWNEFWLKLNSHQKAFRCKSFYRLNGLKNKSVGIRFEESFRWKFPPQSREYQEEFY